MEKGSLTTLTQTICNAVDDAMSKSVPIKGKDVVMLIGCTGSGKTTVTVYSLGAGFTYRRGGGLSQTKATEGFDIGDCSASVTRGLSIAEVPNGVQGLYLVDPAGTGDTAGLEAELSGAIYRSAVMQAAGTVRIALVMSLDRTKVSNGRRGPAVRDVEHVAALFKKVTDYLDSIGMIVTSDPAYLINGNATSEILARIIDAMEDLDKQCQAEGSLEGMKTTEAGVALLQHLHKHCQEAQNAMQEVEDQSPDLADEDELILSKLSERQCAVYPINVLQDGQRAFFHKFLTSLKPVTAPMEALALTLPCECENELQSNLNEEFSKTRSLLGYKGVNWASDGKLVSNLFDLLKLSSILEEKHILPWAADLKRELCQLLLGQNKAAVAMVLEGVTVGNISKLASGLEALRAMDHFLEVFLKRLPPMDLTQWSSLSAAMCKGVEQAREAVAKLLPTDLCEARWDSFLAKQLYDIFGAVEKLEEPGVTFLHEWGVKLTEHVLSLKATAAQCACAKSVVQAMTRLEEQQGLLPNTVARVLSKYSGQQLVDEGMDNIVKETKANVHEQLQSISDKMVRDRRQSPQACPVWEQLQQLCKSTELNTLLNEDLEHVFIMQPLCAALAPTQDELNSLQSAMEHSSSDEWYSELLDLTQRVSGAGAFGVQMLEAGNLQFDALLNTFRDMVANALSRVKKANTQFRSASVMGKSTAPGRYSIISGCSGHISDDDLPMDDETDEAEQAIDELVMLLPADPLVGILGRPPADTAARALKNIGWTLKATLKDLLKKVRKARDMTWMPCAAVETELCKATVNMKAPVSIAHHAFKNLCNLDDSSLGNLCESLKEAIDEADGVITRMVTQELAVWDTAVTDVMEWPATFSRYVRKAQKLRHLAPKEVGEAVQKLYQKAIDWQARLVQEVVIVSEEQEKWQDFITMAVCKGMAFEESSLFDDFSFQIEFRPLVEMQAKKWKKAAAAAQMNAKFDVWHKLTALMIALEHLGQKDERTMHLLKDVATCRKPLDDDMQDVELRFNCALKEERYWEAYRLISGIQNSSRHVESFKDQILEAVETTLANLSAHIEADDLLKVVTKAQSLIQDIEKCQERGAQEMLVLLEGPLTKLKATVASKGANAADDLQLALDGHRPPMHALKVASAFRGKSRIDTAEEAVNKFICSKRQAFPEMNCEDLTQWIIRHDGARRAMPEELGSNTTAYEDLIQDFIKRFKAAFKKDLALVGSYRDQRKWGDAKRLNQGLRDVIDSVLELEILKPFRAQLKNQRSLLGVGGGGRTQVAKEEIERGDFDFAIRTLLSGDANDIQEICETIHIELNKNMNAAGKASLQRRASVLKSFLDSVGDHPPDELLSLCGEVRASYERTKPMLEQQAMKAVEVGLEAASGSDLDIARLAHAQLQVHDLEGAVAESQRKEFDEAVREFWQRVRQAIGKVGSDIQGLEVQSLSLSLEPLRLWLGCFSNLKAEEKNALLHQLQSGRTDLQAWMRDVLAEPLRRLLDANTVQHEMESRNFSHISRRCKVAQKLQQVLSTAPLDLQPARTRVLQMKDAALKALANDTLQVFNWEYKILKTVNSDLPELHVNESLDEVDRVFNKTVLEVHVQRVSSAQRIGDALKAIIDLRNVANDAPDTYENVNPCLKAALKKLESSPTFNTKAINMLGGLLGRDNVGRLVISEHADIFGAAKDMRNNVIFRRAGETNDSSEVVGRLCADSDLAASDRPILEDVLRQYEEYFDSIAAQYLTHGKQVESVLKEAKTDLDGAAAAYTADTRESSIKLLAHLAACYTVIKCGKQYIEASIEEQQNCLVKPHRAQILTICRLLQVYKKDSFFSRVCRGFSQKKPENHLAQILTGEGKCLTLGLLASFLVLTGMECDIVCYRKFLTEQDSKAMEPFYKFVGIDDKIRYATFDELCQERLDCIKGASKDLLLTGQTCQNRKLRDLSKRALLIDEVDVLFGRRFYGQTWDGGFTLDSPEAVRLVRFIFEERRSGRPIRNITGSEPFKELLSRCPAEMHRALTGTALMLQSSIDGWATPEPILNARTGQIGYKDGDDVNYDISYSNKTVFAYLSYEMEGKITPLQAEKHLGVDLFCGRFSFAEFPKEYCCILGVTGTLRELLTFPRIRKMLTQEYSFKHFTYTPSIFGESRLIFKEAEHVRVSDNESDWLSSIESQIEDVKRTKKSGLIFFKNEAQLNKFPNCSNYECMTERLDPARRAGYVAAATTEGRITLLTRAFGRGIDFQMPDGHEVVVVQTFLSSLISEQTQIKGRTARQGKSGQYRLELCAPHLEAKMGFNAEEIQKLKSGSGEEIKTLLKIKQQAKTEVKAAGMSQRKEKAAQLERETREWEDLLFNPGALPQIKLTHLAQWNGNEVCTEVHYHLLLDNSGSMSGRPWQELTQAFRRFLEELQRDPAAAATTKVSVTLFNGMAHTVCPTHAKVSEVQDIGHHQICNGTSFEAAFTECNKVISQSSPYAREILLFLTDGGAAVPDTAINNLLVSHKNRIKNLTCIAFGGGADASSLRRIGQLFKAHGIDFKLTTPNNQASLVQTFVEAAKSRAIHT